MLHRYSHQAQPEAGAAGVPAAAIRIAGRWASDIYVIYCRCSRQSAARMATVIGSTDFEDIERGTTFCDEELMPTTAERPASAMEAFMEQELADDVLR